MEANGFSKVLEELAVVLEQAASPDVKVQWSLHQVQFNSLSI
jgi:hypothetical protein